MSYFFDLHKLTLEIKFLTILTVWLEIHCSSRNPPLANFTAIICSVFPSYCVSKALSNKMTLISTVAILAQGTSWAVADTQAFLAYPTL